MSEMTLTDEQREVIDNELILERETETYVDSDDYEILDSIADRLEQFSPDGAAMYRSRAAELREYYASLI